MFLAIVIDRIRDIAELTHHFVNQICSKYGIAAKDIGSYTLEMLSA